MKKDIVIKLFFILAIVLLLWNVWLTIRVDQLQKNADNNEWHTRELFNYLD